MVLYVSTSAMGGAAPNDGNLGTSWSQPLRTINEALRRIPKSFHGYVRIVLASGHTFHEDVQISGFIGFGEIHITTPSGTAAIIRGRVYTAQNLIEFRMSRVDVNNTNGYAAIEIYQTVANLIDCLANGRSSGTAFGIIIGASGNARMVGCRTHNISTGIMAEYGGKAFVENCTGSGSQFGLRALGGGVISGSGTAPSGSVSNTQITSGGLITGTWGTSGGTPPPTSVPETTASWISNLQSGTYYNTWWDTDGYHADKVTQGWSGGANHRGAWFYGTGVQSTVQGKSIRRIRISMERFPSGSYSNQTIVLGPHTSASRPSGFVSMQNPSHSVSFGVGERKWVTLPSSFHAGFEAGTYRGIGIDGSDYVAMSRGTVLEITYV